MIVKDGYSRYLWLHFLKKKSDAGSAFRPFLANVHADGVSSNVGIVRVGNGGKRLGGIRDIFTKFLIKQESTRTGSVEFNGVAERELGTIDTAAAAARS